jgi:hypothetical protein
MENREKSYCILVGKLQMTTWKIKGGDGRII